MQKLLAGTQHTDPKVSKLLLEVATERGWLTNNPHIPESPPLRTDLGTERSAPLSVARKTKQMLEKLEKQVKKTMEDGPAQDAVELYRSLLKIKPDAIPYQEGLALAQAYVKTANNPQERWLSNARYIGVKGRYEYYLTQESKDLALLRDMYDLAEDFRHANGGRWSKSHRAPLGKDFVRKFIRLHKHLAKNCPATDLLAFASCVKHLHMSQTTQNGMEEIFPRCLELLKVEPDSVVDSTRIGFGRNIYKSLIRYQESICSYLIKDRKHGTEESIAMIELLQRTCLPSNTELQEYLIEFRKYYPKFYKRQ